MGESATASIASKEAGDRYLASSSFLSCLNVTIFWWNRNNTERNPINHTQPKWGYEGRNDEQSNGPHHTGRWARRCHAPAFPGQLDSKNGGTVTWNQEERTYWDRARRELGGGGEKRRNFDEEFWRKGTNHETNNLKQGETILI